MESNVNRRSGRKKLDENKIKFIQNVVFEFYLMKSSESKTNIRRHCVRAIDEGARYLRYLTKK